MKFSLRMRPSSGFTLIELIVSSALMSMIIAAAYACLRSGVASQKLIESREDLLQNARVAMTLLSADLRAACPISTEFEFIGMDRMMGKIEADNLDFATHHYKPRRARESDFCEVSYFLQKDTNTTSYVLWRRRDPTPDEEPFAGGEREEIARGLKGLRFEYYDGFEWFDEWGDPQGKRKGPQQTSSVPSSNLSGLPEAVRITLWLDPNPRPAKDTAEEETTSDEEPALAFQTVVRLNLAPAFYSSSSGGAAPAGSGNQNNSGLNPSGNTGRFP